MFEVSQIDLFSFAFLCYIDIFYCLLIQNPSGAVTSLDGNFGLVHKRRTGGLEKARHQNVFFFKDENVQQFVQDWAADRRNIATVGALFVFSGIWKLCKYSVLLHVLNSGAFPFGLDRHV